MHARVSAAPAALLVLAIAAGCGGTRQAAPPAATRPATLRIVAAGRTLATVRAASPARAVRLAALLPVHLEEVRGRSRRVLAVPRGAAAAAIAGALRRNEPRVTVPTEPVSSSIRLRPVQQLLKNDCEATALSMLLAAAGVRAGQLELQRRLPRSGPLDPVQVEGSELVRWGDPRLGFVGRADGGGPAGGFGVYEAPVRALARRYGVALDDLSGEPVRRVRAAVLDGRPVLAWVGLADGPYRTWLTPSGRPITVNLNEHALVLVGAGPGYVVVDDPLSGRRVRWSEALFSVRWRRLGRRALALPAR